MTVGSVPMDKPLLRVRTALASTIRLWDAHTGEYKPTLKGRIRSMTLRLAPMDKPLLVRVLTRSLLGMGQHSANQANGLKGRSDL